MVFDHLTDHGAATLGHFGGCGSQLVGLGCGFGTLAHGGRDFFHAAGGLLQVTGGGLGAVGQILVAGGHLGSSHLNVVAHLPCL
jgi:hypothetical protein